MIQTFDLVCFDVDGTLIDDIHFIWQELHDFMGSDHEHLAAMKNAFFAGEITYAEWAASDVAIWRKKGATRSVLATALARLQLMPGAHETLLELKHAGIKLAIVSGSLDIAIEALLPDHRSLFDRIFLNRLLFDEQDLVLGVEATPYDMEHKADGVRAIAGELGVLLARTVFVGDHFNDVAAASIVGLPIAFNSKSPELDAVCKVCIRDKDLRLILQHILG